MHVVLILNYTSNELSHYSKIYQLFIYMKLCECLSWLSSLIDRALTMSFMFKFHLWAAYFIFFFSCTVYMYKQLCCVVCLT